MKPSRIVFDDSCKEDILDIFGKKIDDEGFIVEKGNSNERVLTKQGEEILADEWAGVEMGSESFVKSDILSLIQLAKKIQ